MPPGCWGSVGLGGPAAQAWPSGLGRITLGKSLCLSEPSFAHHKMGPPQTSSYYICTLHVIMLLNPMGQCYHHLCLAGETGAQKSEITCLH